MCGGGEVGRWGWDLFGGGMCLGGGVWCVWRGGDEKCVERSGGEVWRGMLVVR